MKQICMKMALIFVALLTALLPLSTLAEGWVPSEHTETIINMDRTTDENDRVIYEMILDVIAQNPEIDETEIITDVAENYAVTPEQLRSYMDWVAASGIDVLAPVPEISSTAEDSVSGEVTASGDDAELVWVPTKGGKKYHTESSCSGMDEPIQMTRAEAEKLGFGNCKKC